jgi:hypothetical protein
LGTGDDTPSSLVDVFRAICQVPVEDDGLSFLPESVTADTIREDQVYGGVRVKLVAAMGKTRISLQIDIGFGDAVTPPALPVVFPALLNTPLPHLHAYPRETVVAEKL